MTEQFFVRHFLVTNALPAFLSLIFISLSGCSKDPTPKEPAPVKSAGGPRLVDVDVPPGPATVPAGGLAKGREFGQTFVSRHNGLAKLEVLMATYTKQIPSGMLEIRLRASADQTVDLASVEIPAQSIRDNRFVALEFPPIPDSAGKTYYFCLRARDIPAGYALTVWLNTGDVYKDGQFFHDRHADHRDVCFRTSYASQQAVARPFPSYWHLLDRFGSASDA